MVNKVFLMKRNDGRVHMNNDDARIIALQVLAWLAADDDLFGTFLGASGADIASVRAAADSPVLLAGVLDFVLQQDDWVLACANGIGVVPQMLVNARAVLGGRDQMHWT